MKRLALIALFSILAVVSARAQTSNNPVPPNNNAGAYNASPPTCTDGLPCWIQTDINGNLKTTTATASSGLSTIATAALASNLVVNAASTKLHSFIVSADSTLWTGTWYVMIFNATSAPADGAVTPAKCYTLPIGTTSLGAAWPNPVRFSTGVTIVVSTAGCFSKTATVHAFISGDYE